MPIQFVTAGEGQRHGASRPPGREAAESSTEETAATGSSQAWAVLIKRVYEIDPLCCPECGGQMQVVSFIEPPQADVIEAILKHCGLWQPFRSRAPPDVQELVLALDADYSGNLLDTPIEADESHELTYVDIDTFLANFYSSPTRVGTRTLRPFGGLEPHFAYIDAHFLLGRPPLNSPSPEIGKVWLVRESQTSGVIPIPEPASITMWTLGALCMMFAPRKRKQMKFAA